MATHPTMNSMNRQKGITSEDEPLRSEGILYATAAKWRTVINSSQKNEVVGPKQK